MNAYHLAMLLIVFNLSFCFLAATNIYPQPAQIVHGKEVEQADVGSVIDQVVNILKSSGIGGFLGALAGLIGSIATRSWAPVAIGVFSGIFWGSVWDTSRIITDLTSSFGGEPLGLSFFSTLFLIIASFIFAMMIIQMLSGGVKTYE